MHGAKKHKNYFKTLEFILENGQLDTHLLYFKYVSFNPRGL